jgi:hypothetical protein
MAVDVAQRFFDKLQCGLSTHHTTVSAWFSTPSQKQAHHLAIAFMAVDSSQLVSCVYELCNNHVRMLLVS